MADIDPVPWVMPMLMLLLWARFRSRERHDYSESPRSELPQVERHDPEDAAPVGPDRLTPWAE